LVAEFKKRNNKAKRTICDAVRDHILPHLTSKDYAYEMWVSLCKFYQSSNQNRKMVLFERLGSTRMLKDELSAIEEIVDPDSMVRTTLNSFTKPWGPSVRGIVARELLPTWERLWDDFVQEETRLNLRDFWTTTDIAG
jgi:hypothetical protein